MKEIQLLEEFWKRNVNISLSDCFLTIKTQNQDLKSFTSAFQPDVLIANDRMVEKVTFI